MEELEAHEVCLFDKVLGHLHGFDELDVPLLLILAEFHEYRIVNELEELLFEVVLRRGEQLRVFLDIGLEHARLR